jgi:hypothetical protein
LTAQYTVKIDPNNGAVSGFGLASTTNNSTTTSEFYIRADKFGIVNAADANLNSVTSPFLVDTDPAFSEKVFAVSGDRFPAAFTTQAQVNAANAALPSTSPFNYVFTAANTSIFLNGDAVIKRASIDSSVIKDLTVDKILRVPGEAFINEADIEDLSITTAHIKNYIESTNYANTANNFAGWRIDKNGSANFHDLTIRDSSGAILLSTGTGIDFTGITYNDIGGTKPPSNADKTSSNTAAGIAGQGSLATQSSVAFSALTGTKPPSNADKTSSNTAAGIAGQGAYATVDKLVATGDENLVTFPKRRAISTFIADLAVDSLQIAGEAVSSALDSGLSGYHVNNVSGEVYYFHEISAARIHAGPIANPTTQQWSAFYRSEFSDLGSITNSSLVSTALYVASIPQSVHGGSYTDSLCTFTVLSHVAGTAEIKYDGTVVPYTIEAPFLNLLDTFRSDQSDQHSRTGAYSHAANHIVVYFPVFATLIRFFDYQSRAQVSAFWVKK